MKTWLFIPFLDGERRNWRRRVSEPTAAAVESKHTFWIACLDELYKVSLFWPLQHYQHHLASISQLSDCANKSKKFAKYAVSPAAEWFPYFFQLQGTAGRLFVWSHQTASSETTSTTNLRMCNIAVWRTKRPHSQRWWPRKELLIPIEKDKSQTSKPVALLSTYQDCTVLGITSTINSALTCADKRWWQNCNKEIQYVRRSQNIKKLQYTIVSFFCTFTLFRHHCNAELHGVRLCRK